MIDFGRVRAYSYFQLSNVKHPRVGDRLEGRASLFVDPFFYFEEMAELSGVPPAIYTWRIDAIELCVSAVEWVPKDDPRVFKQYRRRGGTQTHFRVRVGGPDKWRTIEKTRMWKDDDESIAGGYRLQCTLQPDPPTLTR